MAIDVRIPTVMRSNTGGQAVVSAVGSTIGEVLADITGTYESLKAVLFTDDGELHKYVNIYVDADDIRYIGGLDAPVGNAKDITILPAVAGGER